MMTNSITSIINVISYVLIAFVAVSLVVSCIMIGIVTYICSSQSWFTENIKECATELKSEGKQVAYIVCNEKVISVIGYRENE